MPSAAVDAAAPLASDKENCQPAAAPTVKSAGRPPQSQHFHAPPLSRRSSSSILRGSLGPSSGGWLDHCAATDGASSGGSSSQAAKRSSLPAARRKSVSFAASMEQVRLFDSRVALALAHSAAAAAVTSDAATATATAATTGTATDTTASANVTDDNGSSGLSGDSIEERPRQRVPSQPAPLQRAQQQPHQHSEEGGAEWLTNATAASESSEQHDDSNQRDDSESMELTELVTTAAATVTAASATAQCAPTSPSVDMELTALLHTLPALVTAASRAARRASISSGATSNSDNNGSTDGRGSNSFAARASHSVTASEQQELRPHRLPLGQHDDRSTAATATAAAEMSATANEECCDLIDWLTPPVALTAVEEVVVDSSGGIDEQQQQKQQQQHCLLAADDDSNMEMTELLNAHSGGANDGSHSNPPHPASGVYGEDDDTADMEMTAILSKWSERSHGTALSPFAGHSLQRQSDAGSSCRISNSPSPALSRLSHRLTRSPAPHSTAERSEGGRRLSLSSRLSVTLSAEANTQQTRQQGMLSSASSSAPAFPLSTRLSVLAGPRLPLTGSASRVSAGIGNVGEQTAVLSARWLQMMDDEQQQHAQHASRTARTQQQPTQRPTPDDSGDEWEADQRQQRDEGETEDDDDVRDKREQTERFDGDELMYRRRVSSASSVAVGDCTADIASMLEAVLMDGQSAEEAMHAYQQQTNDRRERRQRQQQQPTDDDTVGSETVEAADDTREAETESHQPAVLEPSTDSAAALSPVRRYPFLVSGVAGPRSPVWSSSVSLSPSGSASLSAAEESSAGPAAASPAASFLDSAFHLLGVSSMDDSNLHAKLRKRDSSFQPAAALHDDDCHTATAINHSPLLSALLGSLVAGEEADELQSLCLQLMDVNAQLRDESADTHSRLAERHTATVAAVSEADSGRSSLHRFLSAIARSTCGPADTARPAPSPALCRAVSSQYNLCVQSARLSWLRWQSEWSGVWAGQCESSGRQLEADVDMAAEIAAMQTAMQRARQAALQRTTVRDGRQAALNHRRRCTVVQQQLTQLAEQTAAQQRLESAMALSLRDNAIAMQATALRVNQQLSETQQRKQIRMLLSATAEVSQCRLVAATPSHVDIALHGLPFFTLRCERVCDTRPPVAVEGYRLSRRSNERLNGSSHLLLHGSLMQALCCAVDDLLSTEGVHVQLPAVPALLRRCTGLLHRALQWQRSTDAVGSQYGSRLVASFVTPSLHASDQISLSVRCQSPNRQHQLVCTLVLSLAAEPRSVSSISRHDLKVVSLTRSSHLGEARQQFSQWMSSSRVDGYGQLQRVAGKLMEILSTV